MLPVKTMLSACAIAASLLICSHAKAAPLVADFQHMLKGNPVQKAVAEAYILSSTKTFTLVNVTLEGRGDKPLFCAPAKLAITKEQATQIVVKFVDTVPAVARFSLETVLLRALRDTFPCVAGDSVL